MRANHLHDVTNIEKHCLGSIQAIHSPTWLQNERTRSQVQKTCKAISSRLLPQRAQSVMSIKPALKAQPERGNAFRVSRQVSENSELFKKPKPGTQFHWERISSCHQPGHSSSIFKAMLTMNSRYSSFLERLWRALRHLAKNGASPLGLRWLSAVVLYFRRRKAFFTFCPYIVSLVKDRSRKANLLARQWLSGHSQTPCAMTLMNYYVNQISFQKQSWNFAFFGWLIGFYYKSTIVGYLMPNPVIYPWPSLASSPYRSSPLEGLQGYIPYPHITAVCMFELVVLLLLVHMWGSIGVHPLWARPFFSSSVLRVWFVKLA